MINAPNSYKAPINRCPQTTHTYTNESKVRSSLFWHFTLLRLVVSYRCFGTTYRSYLLDWWNQWVVPKRRLDCLTVEDGTDCPETSVTINLCSITPKNSEDLICTTEESWNYGFRYFGNQNYWHATTLALIEWVNLVEMFKTATVSFVSSLTNDDNYSCCLDSCTERVVSKAVDGFLALRVHGVLHVTSPQDKFRWRNIRWSPRAFNVPFTSFMWKPRRVCGPPVARDSFWKYLTYAPPSESRTTVFFIGEPRTHS